MPSGCLLVQVDLVRIIRHIDGTAYWLAFPGLLALHAQQLRQQPAFANSDEIAAGRLAVRAKLRLHNEVLEHALGGNAGRVGFDFSLTVLGLPRIAR
ncbi:hypothetical protein [Mesorhizobium sp. M1E.F.Ca.ET.045.02.1.1]|uniref:hypothetical protein n=1 Tax=Mesorhizobium sp. M1E.F.Ca.ET.045.02.1.1 TaxID=2493672 RepID=UPI001FE091F0|nr:hypothetical protein [Mesorhizobium sp. M1E.F.Ca.ET.045.02.1.1]